MALYTIPADFIGAKILGIRANVVTKVSTGATVYLFTRDNANANPIWRVRDVIGTSESAPIEVNYPISPITVGPKTDVRLHVQAVTANDTDIAGAFWLEQLSDS